MRTVLFCLVVVVLAVAGLADIKKVAPAESTSGRDTFERACVSCHGEDGKGHGTMAASLSVEPPDLTTLSLRNNGQFPYAKVAGTIAGDASRPEFVHRQMPCFGLIFRSTHGDNLSNAQTRVANLTEYIRSIQAK